MITRWTHAHTAAAALVGGLVLSHHVMYVFALGLLIGALVVYSSRTLRAVLRAGRNQVADMHQRMIDRLDADSDLKHARAAEAVAKAEHRILRAAEQAKEVERAFVRGIAEGEHHAESVATARNGRRSRR